MLQTLVCWPERCFSLSCQCCRYIQNQVVLLLTKKEIAERSYGTFIHRSWHVAREVQQFPCYTLCFLLLAFWALPSPPLSYFTEQECNSGRKFSHYEQTVWTQSVSKKAKEKFSHFQSSFPSVHGWNRLSWGRRPKQGAIATFCFCWEEAEVGYYSVMSLQAHDKCLRLLDGTFYHCKIYFKPHCLKFESKFNSNQNWFMFILHFLWHHNPNSKLMMLHCISLLTSPFMVVVDIQ